jgi:hypothetical protein
MKEALKQILCRGNGTGPRKFEMQHHTHLPEQKRSKNLMQGALQIERKPSWSRNKTKYLTRCVECVLVPARKNNDSTIILLLFFLILECIILYYCCYRSRFIHYFTIGIFIIIIILSNLLLSFDAYPFVVVASTVTLFLLLLIHKKIRAIYKNLP